MSRATTPPFILLFLSLCLLAMFAATFASFWQSPTSSGDSRHDAAARDAAPAPTDLFTPAEGEPDALTEQQAANLSELMRRIQDNPQDAEALTEIGEAFLMTKDWARADVFLSRAISAAPTDIRPRSMMGVSLYRQGRMAEAAGVFEKLLSIQKNADAQYNLAVIYKYHLNRVADAHALLHDIVDSDTAAAGTKERAKKELE